MSSVRFKLACRMLRGSTTPGFGGLSAPLPGQRKGESPIDWLVRLGLAKNAHLAAEMLIVGQDIKRALDELEQDPDVVATLDLPAK